MGLAPSEARDNRIKIHGPEAFEGMRQAGRLAAETLDFITPYVQPGVATDELDALCHGFIVCHDAIPAPLNYRGFPKSICTSINHVVCHGIPGERRLMEGDILNIDVTVILDQAVRREPEGIGTAIRAGCFLSASVSRSRRGGWSMLPTKR